MKKISIAVIVVLTFLLQGCIVSSDKVIQDKISAFEAKYNVIEGHGVIMDYQFIPDEFYLNSVNTEYLFHNGFVRRHAHGSGDVVVSVEVEFSHRHAMDKKIYELRIIELDEPDFVSSEALTFSSLSNEYEVTHSEIVVHHFDNDIVYVEVETFINALDKAIDSHHFEYVKDEDQLYISYAYEDESYTMHVDFSSNEIIINSFSFFDAMSSATTTDFGKGLSVESFLEIPAQPVVLPVGEYGIDLIVHEGLYLFPMHLANLMFSGSMYDMYYNGDALVGFDTYQLMDDPATQGIVHSSRLNSATMSRNLKFYSYNFLAFSMDYFYGLKDFEGVDTYYNVLGNTFYMYDADDRSFYRDQLVFAFARDDLHTSFVKSGIYEPLSYSPQVTIDHIKERTLAYYETYWANSGYCDALPDYEVHTDSKTLMLNINGFDADTPDKLKEIFEVFVNLNEIDNIVYNIACNQGGNIGSTLRVIGTMTDDAIPLHSIMSIDHSSLSQYILTEEVANSKNLYVVTSKLTYSAANLMASIAKEMQIATILGQKSSGGACAIQTLILPDGTILLISSHSAFANAELNLIENGIEPDVYLTNPFNKLQIYSFIKNASN